MGNSDTRVREIGLLKFVDLSEIREDDILDLMNNEMVGRLLPLLSGTFTADNCRDFLTEKKRLWDDYGYGPWAFVIDGAFAGWGGLQPEHGEADFALVLDPAFWGWGRKIFDDVKTRAFDQMGIDAITILFPPSRTNSKAIARLGFVEVGELNVDGELFRRFRLTKPIS